MPKYRVLRALPQGQQPGEIVELHEDVGKVFLLVAAVEPIAESEPPKPRRGSYKRADLRAEHTEDLTSVE